MITVIYLRVISKADPSAPDPSYYDGFTNRFIETYKKFKPSINHRLLVVCCGGGPDESTKNLFSGLDATYESYLGQGWDNGAFIEIAKKSTDDIVVCFSTPIYFWREDWLSKITHAVDCNGGNGVFGFMASYQRTPHIRTSCFAFNPTLVRSYPNPIESRCACIEFESGHWNFSTWAKLSGFPVMLVASDGVYQMPDWRKPENIFRRGDQSNCLVWDRHIDIYRDASEIDKLALSREADGYV